VLGAETEKGVTTAEVTVWQEFRYTPTAGLPNLRKTSRGQIADTDREGQKVELCVRHSKHYTNGSSITQTTKSALLQEKKLNK